tara:strand:- start:377 stop:655 length:279 start_codon:yes stop_codon:yes gene_type:complete
MDTDITIKKYTYSDNEISPDVITASGEFFSGMITIGSNDNNRIIFELVNKEKMSYILKDIKFNKEVRFEIFSYDEYPKEIQYQSNWDKIKQK